MNKFKRIISLGLSLMLLFSSIAIPVDVMADNSAGMQGGPYHFTFDNNASYEYAYDGLGAKIIEDNDNAVLQGSAISGKNYNALRFPVELEVGKTYTYSFRYKVVGLGASGETQPSKYQLCVALKSGTNANNYTFINGAPTLATPVNWKTFTTTTAEYETVTGTFTTTSSNVTSSNKYFSILFTTNTNAKVDFYIDDIKVAMNGGTIAFNTQTDAVTAPEAKTGSQGANCELPTLTGRTGYEFSGWYTDAACTQKVESITYPAAGITTTLYAGWLAAPSIFDFETENQYSYAYDGLEASVIEENSNHVLMGSAISGKNYNAVRFPVELETGKTYTYSFRYKVVELGASGETQPSKHQLCITLKSGTNANNYTFINGAPTLATPVNWKTFTTTTAEYETVTGTFTTTSSNVTSSNKYFSILFTTNTNAKVDVYIDDIKVAMNGGTIAFNTQTDAVTAPEAKTGSQGENCELPTLTGRTGYEFSGWYTDAACTQKVESVTYPAAGITTTLYAGWLAAPSIFDFETDNQYSYAYDGLGASIIDETNNHALQGSAISGKNYNAVRFPVELEVGKTYTYSFRYKVVGLGASGETQPSKYQLCVALKSGTNANNYTFINGAPTLATPVNWKTFTTTTAEYETVTGTFTTTSGNVTSSNKYFSILFTTNTNAKVDVYIDDVIIAQQGGTVTFNTQAESIVAPEAKTGGFGLPCELPQLSGRAGYEFLGWYEDAGCTQKVESMKYPAMGATVTLYAGWKLLSVAIDFETENQYSYAYDGLGASIIDETDNHAFQGSAIAGKNYNALRLPIELEAGKTYAYTFKYKVVGLGASGETQPSKYQLCIALKSGKNVNNYTFINGAPTLATPVNWKTYTATTANYETVTGTFTTTTSNVTNENKYFSMLFTTNTDSKITFYLDDILVSESGSITFETNGGNNLDTLHGMPNATAELPTPIRSGYRFTGWYTDANLTIKAENVLYPQAGETTTIYAAWETASGDEETKNKFDFSSKYDLAYGDGAQIVDERLVMKTKGSWGGAKARIPYTLEKGSVYKLTYDIAVNGQCNPRIWPMLAKDATDWNFIRNSETKYQLGAYNGGTLEAGRKYQHSFVFAADSVDNEFKYLGFFVQNENPIEIYIDNVTIEKVSLDDFDYVTEKTYHFNNEDGINVLPTNCYVSGGYLNQQAQYQTKIGLDYMMKEGKTYVIEILYDVVLKAGQKQQNALITFDYGTVDAKKGELGNSGWLSITKAGKAKAKFVVKEGTFSTLGNYLWITLDSNDGKTDPTKGGGLLKIDKIIVKEVVPTVPVETKTITFDNDNNINAFPEGCVIQNGTLISNGYGSRLGLDVMLYQNAHCIVEIKYKVTGKQMVNVEAYTGTSDTMNKKDGLCSTIWKWSTLENKDWQTQIVEFDTTEKMMKNGAEYLWFYFDISKEKWGKELIIDEITISQYTATVNLKAKYNGMDIDIKSIYGQLGETLELPKDIVEPFEAVSWYSDAGLTKAVNKNYLLSEKNTTLYAKVTKKTKAVIDFEDKDDVRFLLKANVQSEGGSRNQVLTASVSEAYGSAYAKLNYMWQPDRIYEVTFRYKTNGKINAQLAFRNATNEDVWNCAGGGFENTFSYGFYGDDLTNTGWETKTMTIITDDPKVDNVHKYLYLHFRDTKGGGSTLYIDDIVIVDKGAFLGANYNPGIDSYTWDELSEDSLLYADWKEWKTGSKGTGTEDDDKDNVFTAIKEFVTSKTGKYAVIISVVSLVFASGVVTFVVLSKRKKKAGKKTE